MTSTGDSSDDAAIELLRRLRPQPRVSPHLVAQLARARRVPRTERSRRPIVRVAGAAAIAAVAVAGAAAWRWASNRDVEYAAHAACYETEPGRGQIVEVSFFDGSPVGACRQLWRDGTLTSPEPEDLTWCVDQQGASLIIPGGSGTCERYDLARPSDRPLLSVPRALEQKIDSALLDSCLSSTDAVSLVRAIVDEEDPVPGWTVVIDAPTDDARPCAVTSWEPSSQRILLKNRRDAAETPSTE